MYSVSSFAEKKGISVSRVRSLVASGEIPFARVGNMVVISDHASSWHPRSRRPLSVRMSSALMDAMVGSDPDVSPKEISRIRGYLQLILSSPHPSKILSDFLSLRGRKRIFSVHQEDMVDLRNDDQILLSGSSNPAFGLSSEGRIEAYVAASNFDAVVKEYMLRPDPAGEVVLRCFSVQPKHALPLAAADLADGHGGRELREADRVALELAKGAL